GVAFRTDGYLMSMEIVQAQLVQQRLFHDLVREEKRLDPHRLRQPAKCPRQVAIDEDGISVHAITGDIGDVVIATDDANAPANCFYRVQQYLIFDVFGLMADFAFQLHDKSTFWISAEPSFPSCALPK